MLLLVSARDDAAPSHQQSNSGSVTGELRRDVKKYQLGKGEKAYCALSRVDVPREHNKRNRRDASLRSPSMKHCTATPRSGRAPLRRTCCLLVASFFFIYESAFVVNLGMLIIQAQWSLSSGPLSQSHTRTRRTAPRARPLPRPGGKEVRFFLS